ncbi:unnamed protein product [Peniophora sp. CBMAI 1063]|nr:unnamed protein product [Peniophora sp. CBMAI 1063]
MAEQNMDVDVVAEDVWTPLVDQRFTITPNAIPPSQLTAFDAELAYANKAVLVAKKRRNLLAPACRLPFEILSTIFALVQQIWTPGVERERKVYEYDLGWLRVSHVCQYWRNVAVQTPSLWTKIPCLALPPRAAFWFYLRSRHAPLHLTLETEMGLYDPPTLGRAVSSWFAPSVLSRVHSLSLGGSLPDLHALVKHCRHPMLNISHLSVCADQDNPQPTYRLPRRFCHGTQPTRLVLEGCLPHWDSTLLASKLTHLTLRSEGCTDLDALPFWAPFAALLASLRSLEELDLYDVFPLILPTDTDTASLPHTLKTLNLEASGAANNSLVELFNHVELRSRAKVRIAMHGVNDEQHADSIALKLRPFLARLFAFALDVAETPTNDANNDEPDSELVVSDKSIDLYTPALPRSSWTASTSSSSLASVLSRSPPPARDQARIQLAVEYKQPISVETAKALTLSHQLSALPLHRLSALGLDRRCVQDLVQEGSVGHLSAAINVRRLGVEAEGCAPLFDALLARASNGTFDLLPALDTIHVQCAEYEVDMYRPEELEKSCEADMLALLRLVTERREGGAAVGEVVVQRELVGWRVWEKMCGVVQVRFEDFWGEARV